MAVRTTARTVSRRQPDAALTLDGLTPGTTGRILAIEEHDDDQDCRLRELGLYEGAEVRVLSQGDPVVVLLFDSRFAICRRCARHVTVAEAVRA